MIKKRRTKSIVCAVVAIAIILGCAAGAVAIFGNKTKSISPTFTAGSLDLAGQYVENNETLYTKELVDCLGLSITPDFENDSDYQIFWYNHDGIFLGSEERTDEAFTGKVPSIARYCRIVLYPDLTEAKKELKKGEEFKFTVWNTKNYTDDINVKIYRNQDFKPEDFFTTAQLESTSDISKITTIASNYSYIRNATLHGFSDAEHNTLVNFMTALKTVSIEGYEADENNGYAVIKLHAANVEKYEFIFGDMPEGAKYYVFYYDEAGNAVYPAEAIIPTDNTSYIIDIPENTDYVCINVYPADLDEGGETVPFVINEYTYRVFER